MEQAFPNADLLTDPATGICSLQPEFCYRGYPVETLATVASYSEVVWLLLHEDLPNQEQLADFQTLVVEQAELEPDLLRWLEMLPLHVPGIDVLRTAVSLLALDDLQSQEAIPATIQRILQRLLSQLPVVVAARQRVRHGLGLLAPRVELSFSANLFWLFTGREATVLEEQALDRLLILAAEHEFSESTVAVRLTASVRSDFYSGVITGLSTFRGILQAGVTDPTLQMWKMFQDATAARAWASAVAQGHQPLPGFGHRAYRKSDPRAELLGPICRQLAAATGRSHEEEIAAAIEEEVWQAREVLPTFLWPAVRTLDYLGWDGDSMLPMLAIARLAGWSAHFLEQLKQGPTQRPRARKPATVRRRFRPLEERG